jgi:two-component system cell cycle response regulator
VGVASFPDDGAEPAMVLAAADRALFAAKNAGRNTVRVAGQ